MFPQLKNMDQDSLIKLLQNGNTASLDSESRVIYTHTIQSFYKDSTNENKRNANNRQSENIFSND